MSEDLCFHVTSSWVGDNESSASPTAVLSGALVPLQSSRFGFKRTSALMFPWEEWNKPLLHRCADSSLISRSGSSTLLGVSWVIMKHNQKNNKAVHVSEWSCSCAGEQECLKHNCTVVSYAVELPISLSLMGNLIYSPPEKKNTIKATWGGMPCLKLNNGGTVTFSELCRQKNSSH